MVNLELDEALIQKHAIYIQNSHIDEEINKLCLKKFCEQLSTRYGKEFVMEHIRFCEYLLNEVKNIDSDINNNLFLGKVEVLENKVEEIKQKFPNVSKVIDDESEIRKDIKYWEQIYIALGYEKFVAQGIRLKGNIKNSTVTVSSYVYDQHGWGAYGYVMALGQKVCPYCNRNYITPLYSKKGKVRADLDHFFPKHKYPYLSISLFNLVPSCRFCNSSLKGKQNFTIRDNFHPFSEIEADDLFHFTYVPQSIKGFWDKEEMNIEIVYNSNNPDAVKAKNNNDIFCIGELYQYHKDIVENLVKKRYIYSDVYIEYLLNKYPIFWKSKREILDFLIMEYIPEKVEDVPFAKLRKDIIEELGL